jgi:hypothetical protein
MQPLFLECPLYLYLIYRTGLAYIVARPRNGFYIAFKGKSVEILLFFLVWAGVSNLVEIFKAKFWLLIWQCCTEVCKIVPFSGQNEIISF